MSKYQSFYNNDGGSPNAVHFDYIWIEVICEIGLVNLSLNGSGDFGWSTSHAGDVNGDGIDDVIIGAPETLGTTPGQVYIKHGSRQIFDQETIGSTPAGWSQITPSTNPAVISENTYYGSSGRSIEFDYSGTGDLAEIEKEFSPVNHGIVEFYARTSKTDTWIFFFRLLSSISGDVAATIGFGHTTAPTDYITYWEGDGTGGGILTRIQQYTADTWYHFMILFNNATNTYDIFIDGILKVEDARYQQDNTMPDTIEFKQRTGTTHTDYVDNVVLLTNHLDDDITGEVNGDCYGFSLDYIGEVDTTGYESLVVGAPFHGINEEGAIYTFSYISSLPSVASSADHKNNGEADNDHFGWSLAYAGDVNGDGYDDIIVGAPHNDYTASNAGKIYLFTIPEFPIVMIPIIVVIPIFVLANWRKSGVGR